MTIANDIKVLIFDLGKVLLDYDLKLIAEKLSDRSDKDPEDIIKNVFDIYIALSLDTGASPSELFYRQVVSSLDCELSFKEFKEIWCDIFQINKDMVAYVQELRENYPVYILSNICELHHDHIEKQFNISSWVDEVFVSYKEQLMKPDARIYTNVLEKIKYRPEECIFIDDREENITGARELGIHAILFTNLIELKRELAGLLHKQRGAFSE